MFFRIMFAPVDVVFHQPIGYLLDAAEPPFAGIAIYRDHL